jgi:hypothetical protein
MIGKLLIWLLGKIGYGVPVAISYEAICFRCGISLEETSGEKIPSKQGF